MFPFGTPPDPLTLLGHLEVELALGSLEDKRELAVSGGSTTQAELSKG